MGLDVGILVLGKIDEKEVVDEITKKIHMTHVFQPLTYPAPNTQCSAPGTKNFDLHLRFPMNDIFRLEERKTYSSFLATIRLKLMRANGVCGRSQRCRSTKSRQRTPG